MTIKYRTRCGIKQQWRQQRPQRRRYSYSTTMSHVVHAYSCSTTLSHKGRVCPAATPSAVEVVPTGIVGKSVGVDCAGFWEVGAADVTEASASPAWLVAQAGVEVIQRQLAPIGRHRR